MSFLRKFPLFVLVGFTAFVAAQEKPVGVLTFQSWKDQQVLGSQNQVLRISARIEQVRTSKPGQTDAKDTGLAGVPTGRVKKAVIVDPLAAAEKDLRRAQESLQTANELQFEDYINVYLPTLQDQPDSLNKLAEKLSKEELSEIFKSLVKKGSKVYDAKRNSSSVLDGLAASTRGKAL